MGIWDFPVKHLRVQAGFTLSLEKFNACLQVIEISGLFSASRILWGPDPNICAGEDSQYCWQDYK